MFKCNDESNQSHLVAAFVIFLLYLLLLWIIINIININNNEPVCFAGVEMFPPIKCPKMIWPHSGTKRRSKWGNPFHCPLLMMSLWNVWLLMIWARPVKFLSLVSFSNRCMFIFLKPCLCARSATVGLCLCRSTWGVLHACSNWGCEHCWCPLPAPTGCHVQVETGLCRKFRISWFPLSVLVCNWIVFSLLFVCCVLHVACCVLRWVK